MITSNINIYPKDIENIISTHQEVSVYAFLPDTNCCGKPQQLLQPKLIIFSKKIHCYALNIVNFQQTRDIICTSTLPKNTMGNLVRKDLIAYFINQLSS